MEMVEETADAAGIRNLENEAFQEQIGRQATHRWADLRDREREEALNSYKTVWMTTLKRLIAVRTSWVQPST